MKIQYLYGINSITSALKANRRTMYSLLVTDTNSKLPLIKLAEKRNLFIHEVDPAYIERHATNKPHEGAILKASEIPIETIHSAEDLTKDLYVMLDSVQDPHNMGNIIRTAYYLKASGIILPTKHSSPLSSTVANVSAGAIDFLPIYFVQDLPQFLKSSKSNHWKVLGAGKGSPINNVTEVVAPCDKVILVLGNENAGLRSRVKAECDSLFWIDGGYPLVDSLNVGSACSIFLYTLNHVLKRNN